MACGRDTCRPFLNSDLAGIKLYPDYSRVIHTINTRGASWVATEDCYMIGLVKQDNGTYGASAKINNVDVCAAYVQNTLDNSSIAFVLVKKGQVASTREAYGKYDLKFYGLC